MDSLLQHRAVDLCPLTWALAYIYTHTHTHKIIHSLISANILATLLRPSRLEWQGQGVEDDNMAAVMSSSAVPGSRAAWGRGGFPEGSDPCLKGCPVVQSEGRWSLAALRALLSLWQTTGKEAGVSRQLITCIWTWSLRESERADEGGRSKLIRGFINMKSMTKKWKRNPSKPVCLSVCYLWVECLFWSTFLMWFCPLTWQKVPAVCFG